MVLEQVTAFALTISLGLLAGFIYDFYRALRRSLRLKRAGSFLGDLLFWLTLTVFVFGMLILINAGEVRFYVILGMALGALVYFSLFSRLGYGAILLFFRFFSKAFFYLVSLLNSLWRIVTFPFRMILPALVGPVAFFARVLKAIKRRF